ncbi:MAG: helix-turn-helix domain-containing protein [Candidatus Margulisbacteria bacterium]|nr:helix-turn-helix domain-containing protein [Candidatus Margulisiibacteriota bacterium]MBU1022178.1 helix-turn-helix domain-containing protein [Candidatus Margulisiibacteriota bacterium]MBU1729383.1 helix-turn-helix domain-containing protein [Candidatus Margulisiibacteriota bacterium]MBU1955656.1 helix-turn-helix domain-containing protein [Candidatus Margulisiibacteriota bacterium]
MNKDIKIELGKRIKALRGKYNLSQERLAELARTDYKHIQKLEGKNPPAAQIDTLEKIAKAFKLSVSKLLDFDD